MSVINILVKHFKPNYSTHSLTSSKRRRISWVVWLDIPFNCLFPVSVSSLSALTCTSLLCSCDWNVPEGVFNLAPTKNFTWTNTTTLYISLLRFWITWKLLFLIITHRLISTRSYLTKHVTWYKIAQRLSGDNSRPLQYPLKISLSANRSFFGNLSTLGMNFPPIYQPPEMVSLLNGFQLAKKVRRVLIKEFSGICLRFSSSTAE